MELYIYPNEKDPTQENLKSLRKTIVSSLSNDAVTWEKLEETITKEKSTLFLFEHKEKQYKNEPFYLWYANNAVAVKFENKQRRRFKIYDYRNVDLLSALQSSNTYR